MSAPAARALLLLPDRLDELVFALPAIGALAASGRRLAGLVTPPLRPLAALLPGVGEVIPAQGTPGEVAARLRAGRFAEAVLLAEGLAPARWARQAGIPRRWGYGGWLRSRLLAPPVPRPPSTRTAGRHRCEDHRELLAALEVAAPESWTPHLAIPEALLRAAEERLGRGGVAAGEGAVVGLVPGGSLGTPAGRPPRRRRDPTARWPWPAFAELARALRRASPGLRCVLVAGREDLWPAVRIHEETARFVPLIGPDLDAAGLAGLLARLHLVVAADSELLHLGAAAGTPTVALFGPTDPRRRAPRGPEHRILPGPRGDLRRLPVEPVLEACLGALPTPPWS